MVVRLVRHARQVWPEALPVIAQSFARFLTAPGTLKAEKSTMGANKLNRFRTDKFNSCLWLLSLPTKIHPFRSISVQQQAQFELLRKMATHRPVIHVTRKGYRGIVAVQMAHKKTTAERQSAELKAPSWPPWKEERLGIDAQRGNEGMFSRAVNVLSQMKEAGYSHQLWEQMCTVLAGWDTDHSPTVQTRTLVRRPRSLSNAKDLNPDHYAIWVARIRATRTVREAWACFLAYQDRGLPPKSAIYAEMAEKLIYRRKAVENGFDRSSHSLPGDGPEVYPEPASARDIIYVHTEPPTVEEFLDQMFSLGLRPSGRFLALLLQSAPSFRSGLQYLECSNLTEDQLRVLCSVWSRSSDYEECDLEVLQKLPEVIFKSFIQFLCDHSASIDRNLPKKFLNPDMFPVLAENEQSHEAMTILSDFREDLGERCHPRALWHAIQLVKVRQPPSLQAWNKVLFTLTSPRLGVQNRERSRNLYRILAWHEALAVLQWMRERDIDPVLPGFHALCVAFGRAVDSGLRHPELAEEALRAIDKVLNRGNPFGYSFDAMIENGVVVLKSQFDSLVLLVSKPSELAERSVFATDHTTNSQLAVPSMLHVPGYGLLHSFVRALGLVGDDDGLLHLLQWMSRSAGPLNELADEQLNGDRLKCRTLVAIRVFLERRQSQSIPSIRVASESAVQEAYDIISRTPGWEWPSDAEVEEYCR
ncbi:uncharacterized protein N7459_004255 [Penicillium hispanicum]|uniref:uncharacterized protein n=1 Tax=Penicillium hispanicum TaxID=1080232 RepID=UPI0025413239|nr:uncharacterized protein N7459_004255 [Penicillium hispanicum]KAJ5584455.1 hypothetical protein N7459_004255 [Penicillium hispanicum]